MDHHWALERSSSDGVLASRHVGRSELEVEPLGQVEIELESSAQVDRRITYLDRTTLPLSVQRVCELEVELHSLANAHLN